MLDVSAGGLGAGLASSASASASASGAIGGAAPTADGGESLTTAAAAAAAAATAAATAPDFRPAGVVGVVGVGYDQDQTNTSSAMEEEAGATVGKAREEMRVSVEGRAASCEGIGLDAGGSGDGGLGSKLVLESSWRQEKARSLREVRATLVVFFCPCVVVCL